MAGLLAVAAKLAWLGLACALLLNPFTFLPAFLYLSWRIYSAFLTSQANASRAGVPTSKQTNTEDVASENGLLWYFSFGSNMDPDVLTKRRNNGHKYVTVHGVVHQITQEDMAQIVRTEGGGGSGHHGYYLESVPCEMYNGQTVQALTLLTHPNSRHHQVEPALPSERYLKILQKGARQHNLSGEYQNANSRTRQDGEALAALEGVRRSHTGGTQEVTQIILCQVFRQSSSETCR
ncbi:hypothetical protein WJX82_007970 [Trebouxia sp. C0006]